MSLRLLLLLSVLLGGCATGPTDAPPVCDGRHRRPANPYGTILEPSAARPSPSPSADAEPAPSSGGCA